MLRMKDLAGDCIVYYLTESDDKIVTEVLGRIKEGSNTQEDLSRLAAALTDHRQVWDEKHDQDALCAKCGHAYYRHFDTYADMEPVGCKYCSCDAFVEPVG